MAHNIIFIICYSEKKTEERACEQIGNHIGHIKRKRKSGAYMVACKTETDGHRKKFKNQKWT
jgi:hypothetical protein